MLTVRGLDAFYGKAQALFGLQLEVAAGEVVALIGRARTSWRAVSSYLLASLPEQVISDL